MKRHSVGKGKKRRLAGKELWSHLYEWQSDRTHGGRSIAHVAGALSMGQQPQRDAVISAADDLEQYIVPAEQGLHGWTKKDANDLRAMVSALRDMERSY